VFMVKACGNQCVTADLPRALVKTANHLALISFPKRITCEEKNQLCVCVCVFVGGICMWMLQNLCLLGHRRKGHSAMGTEMIFSVLSNCKEVLMGYYLV
jgi:hypothetical protein